MGDLEKKTRDFRINGGFEKTRYFLVKWGICEEKMCDFRVKWGICEEKTHGFWFNEGFAKRKRVIFA